MSVMTHKSIRMDEVLIQWLESEARKNHRKFSDHVRFLLHSLKEQEEKTQGERKDAR